MNIYDYGRHYRTLIYITHTIRERIVEYTKDEPNQEALRKLILEHVKRNKLELILTSYVYYTDEMYNGIRQTFGKTNIAQL